MAIEERESSKHVDVTLTAEQHARLVRDAEKRGMTLAGYARHRMFDGGPAGAGGDAERVAQLITSVEARLREDLRCAVQALAVVVEDVLRRSGLDGAEVLGHRAAARDAADLFEQVRRAAGTGAAAEAAGRDEDAV
ncbi:MAG TPA: hypothetical protein VFL28_07330 [bacterium]|nr:hypothetical protein [bacterium]